VEIETKEKKSDIENQKEHPEIEEKRSIFWYGVIGIVIFGILFWFGWEIIYTIYRAGKGIGFIEWILKKYLWIHIPYSIPFLLEAITIFVVTLALILLLTYFIGLLFSRRIRNEALIKKIFIHIPLLKYAWNFFEEMHDLVNMIKISPFVKLIDYPQIGFSTLGIITKKHIFRKSDGELDAKPCVFIPYSMFLPNGPVLYPEKEKILKINAERSILLRLMLTYGFGIKEIEVMEMQKNLQKYYTVTEKEKEKITEAEKEKLEKIEKEKMEKNKKII